MERKHNRIRKGLPVLLVLCLLAGLAYLAVPVFAAGDSGTVRITYAPSMLWGGLGRYVEYEMDGVKYRTDEAPSSVNREAWNRMSDDDKRLAYDTLYTTTVRKAAFGENGYAYIKYWKAHNNEWYEANQIWKGRVAKRTFPELQPIFSEGKGLKDLYSDYEEIKAYKIPDNISSFDSDRKLFEEASAAIENYFTTGREYYRHAVDMRANSIGTAISFTAVQCSQMLSTLFFSPALTHGASFASSGMIADVTEVLLEVIGADGGSLVEKVNGVVDGSQVAQLTPAEQVHLYSSYMKTYAKMAEICKQKMDAEMSLLRGAKERLHERSEGLQDAAESLEQEKENEKTEYQEGVDNTFIAPEVREVKDEDETITFAFRWKTEEELKSELFPDGFDDFISGQGDGAYDKVAKMVFDEVLEQKAALDQETKGKVQTITGSLQASYELVTGRMESFQGDLDTLENKIENDLPRDEGGLYSIPVGGTGFIFHGTERFRPELENLANQGKPYEYYYDDLRSHIEEYKGKVSLMLETAEGLQSSSSTLYSEIWPGVQDIVFYLSQLEKLGENYAGLYGDVVWELHNDEDSNNYNHVTYINPILHDEGAGYRGKNFSTICSVIYGEEELPAELWDSQKSPEDWGEELAVTRPKELLVEAYEVYQQLTDTQEILEKAFDELGPNEEAYLDEKQKYYDNMDAWLGKYKDVETKMNNALAEIKTKTDTYETSWTGSFFNGAYDNYGYNPYLCNGELHVLSAFDIPALRSYLEGGGNTATLYNKLKGIAEKAGIYEVETKELIAKVDSLNFEMDKLWDSSLVDYANGKGTPLHTFNSLREANDLDSRWDNLIRDSEDSLYYFNICDIPEICDILKGETEEVLFMRNAIKEIRGYLDADSVNVVSASNRLYDLFKKTTAIKELYESTSYLLNPGLQKTTIANLYANPAEEDDILNTINEVRSKHEGIDYTYPPSQHEGVDEYKPVGETATISPLPGAMIMSAPLYHPAASGATTVTATLKIWDDGWKEVETLNLGESELTRVIDAEEDLMNIPFTGLIGGEKYSIDWYIKYGSGSTDYDQRTHFFDYNAPAGIFVTTELDESTYDVVDVTIVNNSGTELEEEYVYLKGFDRSGGLILSENRPLDDLKTGEKTVIRFELEDVIYTAIAHVEEEGEPELPEPATYTVTFDTDGGNIVAPVAVTEGETVAKPADPTRTGYTFQGWQLGGTAYDFTTAVTADITLKASWKKDSDSSGSSGSSSSGGSGSSKQEPPTQKEEPPAKTDESIKADTTETTTGTTTTTEVDKEKLTTQVEKSTKGAKVVVSMSENKTSTAKLALNNLVAMAEKEITLRVESGRTAMDIPTKSLDTETVKELLGEDVKVEDTSIDITIEKTTEQEVATINTAATTEDLEILGTPVKFNVTASYSGKSATISNFKQYVQRRMEVTKEVADRVTTALVFEEDSSFRPVPTSIRQENGKYYVVVSSRTNSTYVLATKNVSFADTKGKWYEDTVKEMANRQIIKGLDKNSFAGDQEITRAEFAAIVIRALGLPAKGTSAFADVPADSWYNKTVAAAADYGIVSGKGDNKFDPLAKISREEAMQIIYNATQLTPFSGVSDKPDHKAYMDYDAKSSWATKAVDFNLANGLIVGAEGKINPQAKITRGESATVILRILQKAGLVDVKKAL